MTGCLFLHCWIFWFCNFKFVEGIKSIFLFKILLLPSNLLLLRFCSPGRRQHHSASLPQLCPWLVIKVENVKGEVKTAKHRNMETSRVNGDVSSLRLASLYDISLRNVMRNVITEQTSRSWVTTRGPRAVPLLTRSCVTVARGRRQTGSPLLLLE